MARQPQILDRWGRALKRADLTKPLTDGARVGSVRSPLTGYPADGLTPDRLGRILKEADSGEPVRYLELAEAIEERDPHYVGVLGTRRRSVSQIEITVKEAEDVPGGDKQADMIRAWLDRDELSSELFDILDAIGKGYSFTEIVWNTSEGQWMPDRLEYWDPRFFRFARTDLRTPLMIDENGAEQEVPAFRFIQANIQAKSGLPLRSGLARIAAWSWMFKAYTQRDWAIFTQTYGQPLRVGKWRAGASEEDKDTLFRAVANIAGDCAAVIPEDMLIEFVQSPNLGAAASLYKDRADWLDQQISKAVLGQTATTDAIAGGHAVGREHRQVQEDIERADAKALAAILNRDLIRPWIDLEYGPQTAYPKIVIAQPEQEDLAQLATAVDTLVNLGLEVDQDEIRAKYGLKKPSDGAKILTPRPQSAAVTAAAPPVSILQRENRSVKRGDDRSGVSAPQSEEGPSAGDFEGVPISSVLMERMTEEMAPHLKGLFDQVDAMLQAANSLDEFREMLNAAYPDLDSSGIAETLGAALVAANAVGQLEVIENDG